eukprot:1849391-Pyramimonas_sp.AAC.1
MADDAERSLQSLLSLGNPFAQFQDGAQEAGESKESGGAGDESRMSPISDSESERPSAADKGKGCKG